MTPFWVATNRDQAEQTGNRLQVDLWTNQLCLAVPLKQDFYLKENGKPDAISSKCKWMKIWYDVFLWEFASRLEPSQLHASGGNVMLVHHSKTLQSCQNSGQWPPHIEFCTFDRMQNVAGMWDRHSCIPFSAAKFFWKFWKSHKELTLCRQESKTASSSPQMPVGLVWKPLSQLGAEKNPILNPDLKRNYKLLATLHWLKLFWCGHFFKLQSVQLLKKSMGDTNIPLLSLLQWPIWCLHLHCLKRSFHKCITFEKKSHGEFQP